MIRKIITEQLLEECPNCGAPRVTEEKICPYCGTVMTVRKIDTLYLSTVDKAELAEFLESGEYAVVLLAMLTAFAGAALVMWSAASVKRYRKVLKYGKKYTAVVIMQGDELRGTYGAFDAAVGRSVPLKVRFELDGRPTVMLLTGPAGIEIGESITILGYGKDYVVAPRDAA